MNTTVSTRGTASVSHRSAATAPLVLADFGSTYTKVTVVDTCDGRLVATARHPTTLESDVLERSSLRADVPDPVAAPARVLDLIHRVVGALDQPRRHVLPPPGVGDADTG